MAEGEESGPELAGLPESVKLLIRFARERGLLPGVVKGDEKTQERARN
jgi:hypothetical protein